MSFATLRARVDALKAGTQPPPPPSDPIILTSGLSAALSGAVGAALPPRRGQFLGALEAAATGNTATVYGMVSPDPGSASNRAWWHTVFVTQGCALAQLCKTTLSLTDAQLAAVISSARSVTE